MLFRKNDMFQIQIRIAVAIPLLILSSAYADELPMTGSAGNLGEAELSLQSALDAALANNQALAEFDSRLDAFNAIPSQAGALPDPTLGFNALNMPTDTFNLDQDPMTQMQVSLSQAFPFPGKRGLKREAAESEADAASQALLDKRLEIAAGVRKTWWTLAYLDRAINIIDQNQNLMRDFIKIAQTKYKVGDGLQQDVLLAQLELSRLFNRQLPLKALRAASQADLNALMNRPANTMIQLPASDPNINLPKLPPESQLLDQAMEMRPILEVARNRTEASRLRLELAKKEYYPDIKVGAAYGFRDATDGAGRDLPNLATIRLSVNLPIYAGSKQSKAVDQHTSNYFKNKYAYNNSLRSVEADVARYYSQYSAAQDQVHLYSTAIIPQASQTVSAMLSGYQVNKVDFLNVLNAQLMLYNAQISYWESLSNAKRSLANLAAAVGAEDIYE
jgi:cobalt-zinc-cadmium efflux system outer membrane protein